MENFVEFQNWGFNALTLSSFMTIVFTIFQGYGFVMQGRKIFKEESVEAISPVTFFLFLFFFMSFMIYGIEKKSIAIIFNGLLFIPVAPIVFGIFRYKKKINFEEIILFILTLSIVPMMIWIKNKEGLLSILLFFSLMSLVSQVLAVFKNKGIGALDIKLILIFMSTSVFWLMYAISLKNQPLIMFNSMALLLYVSIIILHIKNKK